MMLDELLGYDHVTIQCHDNPDADAIASGYGLYCFFRDKGKDTRLLYSGRNKVRKANLMLRVEKQRSGNCAVLRPVYGYQPVLRTVEPGGHGYV